MIRYYLPQDLSEVAKLYKNPIVGIADDWMFDDAVFDDDMMHLWETRVTQLHDIVFVCEEEDALVFSLVYPGIRTRSVEEMIERFERSNNNKTGVDVRWAIRDIKYPGSFKPPQWYNE